jgi:hypothetical protein
MQDRIELGETPFGMFHEHLGAAQLPILGIIRKGRGIAAVFLDEFRLFRQLMKPTPGVSG